MGRGLLQNVGIIIGTKADLDTYLINEGKLCYAADEGVLYRASVRGQGADVLEVADLVPSDGAVDTDQLSDLAVTEAKIEDSAVTEDKIADESVGAQHLLPGSTILRDPGSYPLNYLSIPSDVADGDVVVVGADTFEVEVVNTDSTDNTANDDFANVTSPLVVVDAVTSYANITFAVGQLVRIENEILRVSAIAGDDVTFLRAQSGTSAASHADANDIFVGDGIVTGVAVGVVATLTPTAFIPKLVADYEEHKTEAITATADGTDGVFFIADALGVDDTACSTDITAAAFSYAEMTGGSEARTRRLCVRRRVVSANDETLGKVFFKFDFDPVVLGILVRQVATPGLPTDFDGNADVTDGLVTIDDNGGSTPLAEDDIITLIVTDED